MDVLSHKPRTALDFAAGQPALTVPGTRPSPHQAGVENSGETVIWICLAAYALPMAGVSYAAQKIVGDFGVTGGLLAIAAMYGAARYYEHRRP